MSVPVETFLRHELHARRERLKPVTRRGASPGDVQALIAEVDAALARLDGGTYGRCEACGEPIEAERLLADPLVRLCLDHLDARERRRLEQDLELAARIQTALLPPRDLRVDGWEIAYHVEPFGHVGGDYCDVIADGGGGRLVLLGDVSGKGVAASILMSNLHATFRSLTAGGAPLDELMSRANHLFCQSTLADHYATLVGVRLAASGEAWIVNAGHWPPVIVRPGRLDPIDSSGVALGMFCDATYQVQRVRLDPGDLLVLYTDGVTEARNRDEAEYGAERLLARAAGLASRPDAGARSVLAGCLADLARFCAGASPADDVTLMVVRRES